MIQTDAGRACAERARLAPDPHALYERHKGLAERVAIQYRGGRVDLEDLEQIARVALVEAADAYDLRYTEESFARYAERLMRSAIKDALRRAGRGGWEPFGAAVEHLGMMAAEAPDEGLAEALARLPDDEHAVIELHVLEGFGIGQVALKLGISRGEARWAKARGLARLASALAARN